MSVRGRSSSPRPAQDADVDMENTNPTSREKPDAKVVIVTNLSRNVVESHLRVVFGFYGQITKVDLPLFGKCESLLV
jgi:RNA-binding protein with serine-rich domain 1